MTKFIMITGLIDEMVSSLLPPYGQGGPLDGLNAWMLSALNSEPESPEFTYERGPVTRWVGTYFGNPRMSRAEAIATMPIQPGDPNPFFQIIDAATRESADYIKATDNMLSLVEVGPITREIWLIPEYGLAIYLTGGDVINMPVFFEIDNITDLCPFSFEKIELDENLEEIITPQETWETWGTHGDSHKPQKIGEKWYRSSNVGSSGSILKASEWAPLMLNGSINPISVKKYKEILNNNNDEIQ